MKCTYCNNEIADSAKFCKFCGKSIGGESVGDSSFVESAPVNNSAVATATMQSAPNKSLNSKFLVVIAIIAVVLIAGVSVSAAVLNSPLSVVGRAMDKSVKGITAEATEIVEKMPVFSFFDDIMTAKYSAETVVETVEIKVYSDVANKQYKAFVEALGFDNNIYISEKDIVAESDFFEGRYGISFETLVEDLESSAILEMLDMDIDEYLELVEDIDAKEIEECIADFRGVYENYSNILSSTFVDIFKDAEITKEDAVEVEIDGKSKELKTYKVYVSADVLEENLTKMAAELLEDETVSDYMAQVVEVMEQEYGYENDFDLEDQLEDAISDIVEEYEDNYEDEDLLVSVYKGQIARVSYGDDEELIITLGMNGKLLEEIAVEVEGDEVIFATTFEDGVFKINADIDGDEVTFEYDTTDSKNNVVFYDGYDEYAFTLDSTEENALTFKYDDEYSGETIKVEFEKDNFEEDWFKTGDFTNILNLNENDLYELAFSFMGI